jgi:hypothetical protein
MPPEPWDELDLEPLRGELDASLPPAEAARTMWAFEHALRAARVDDALLDHLLVAAVCLRAHADGTSPRTVLEEFFRRAVSDEDWRGRFAPLLGLPGTGEAGPG